jgi:hypothetical protein
MPPVTALPEPGVFNGLRNRVAPWLQVAGFLALGKGLLWVGVLISLINWPDLDRFQFDNVGVRIPQEGSPNYLSHLATWDTAHYVHLATKGYRPEDPSCAFYPLWPTLIRLVAGVTHGDPVLLACLMGNALAVLAMVGFWDTVRREWDLRLANWAVAMFAVFPGAMFFHVGYSEPLFMLLIIGLWRGLLGRIWWMAFTSALLLPTSRAVGVFAVLPIGLALLASWPEPTQRTLWSRICQQTVRFGIQVPFSPAKLLALLAAPLLGWGLYLGFMGWATGNPWEGFAAQRHWGVHSVTNLVNLPKFIFKYFQPTAWHAFSGSVLDRLAFGFLLILLPAVMRLDRRLLPWIYILGILPAMSGSFTSFLRYESTVFPLSLALAAWVTTRGTLPPGTDNSAHCSRRTWLGLMLAAVFFATQVFLLWRFVNFRWVG